MSGDSEVAQPFGRGFDFERVVFRVQVGADFESGGRGGVADQPENFAVVGERLGGPVFADLAE